MVSPAGFSSNSCFFFQFRLCAARNCFIPSFAWLQIIVRFRLIANCGSASSVIFVALTFKNFNLGKDDMAPDTARQLLPPGTIIGATINRFEDISERRLQGADYYGAGPFRFTTTKQRLAPVLGTEGYRQLIRSLREAGITRPVVAIGGITQADVPALLDTGIDGIAVSGAISRTDNPIEATRLFLALLSPTAQP